MKTLCIYHAGCVDGFGAAWAVRKFLGEGNVEFHAGVYQEPPPDVAGRQVIIVDFSYKRPVLEEMGKSAKSILVLDHHKSAMEDLDGFLSPNGYPSFFHGGGIRTHYDMNQSGAMLVWKYFFITKTPPRLLAHIEDRDLWRFALPGTKAIIANLFSYAMDFKLWDQLMEMGEQELSVFREQGEAIERAKAKEMESFIGYGKHMMDIDGYFVPALNCPPSWASDAGHILAKGEEFSVTYYDTDTHRVYSLRSSDESDTDCSAIAKQYGGGGHMHAAGFKLPIGTNP